MYRNVFNVNVMLMGLWHYDFVYLGHLSICDLLDVFWTFCVQGVGLKLDDAIAFWKAEFSHKAS